MIGLTPISRAIKRTASLLPCQLRREEAVLNRNCHGNVTSITWVRDIRKALDFSKQFVYNRPSDARRDPMAEPLSEKDKIFYEAVRRAIWGGLSPARILEIVQAATK